MTCSSRALVNATDPSNVAENKMQDVSIERHQQSLI